MKKCKYADKCKGLKAPTCGCDTCKEKFRLESKYRYESQVAEYYGASYWH